MFQVGLWFVSDFRSIKATPENANIREVVAVKPNTDRGYSPYYSFADISNLKSDSTLLDDFSRREGLRLDPTKSNRSSDFSLNSDPEHSSPSKTNDKTITF